MAPVPTAKDQGRPGVSGRSQSGLESLLSASFVKGSRSSSRSRPSATPHSNVERSISSLADSFMLEHRGPSSKPPPSEHDGGTTLHVQSDKGENATTPISNLAHLSYMKNQRNTLRAELKAHLVAGAEAKRSVTSLRRLAFRMAVNISVKEKQIATSARNLATSRKGNYLEGKDAEKRVEELKRALRVEEERNKEILEALERASMLTLQYSAPKPKPQSRQQRSLLSPPPSPTRSTNYPTSPLGSPRTPPRPTSLWHDIRTRIEELQSECKRSQEDGKLLETTRNGLEQEIRSHQAAVEETLNATRSQLDSAKSDELADWEQKGEHKQHEIEALRKEKDTLEQHLQTRNAHKLETAELHESSLRDRLAEKESTREDLWKRLDRGTQYTDTAEHLRKIELKDAFVTLKGEVALLQTDLRRENNARDALQASIEEELSTMRTILQQETDAKIKLRSELETDRIRWLEGADASTALEADLKDARQLMFKLREDLRMTKAELVDKLKVSEERSEADQRHAMDMQKSETQLRELESSMLNLRSDLVSSEQLENELGEVVDHLQSRLTWTESDRDNLQTMISQLQGYLSASSETKAQLEKRLTLVSELESALKDDRDAKTKAEEALSIMQLNATNEGIESEANSVRSHLSTLQDDVAQVRQSKEQVEERLNIELESTQSELYASTEEELQALHRSKMASEKQLEEAFEANETLENELGLARQSKAEIQIRLDRALRSNAQLSENLNSTRSQMSNANADKLKSLRGLKSDVEEKLKLAVLQGAEKRGESFQDDVSDMRLRVAEMESSRATLLEEDRHTALQLAESEGLIANNKLFEADKELTSLREANAKPEEDLNTRVESDMATANAAVEETEKRYEEFGSKLRYKRRLSERNNEIEILINENSDLHNQIGEQTRELGTLKKCKGKLADEMSKKEKYIEELRSSSDKRIKSLNQQQQQYLDAEHKRASQLEFAASFTALERERLVSTLQEKIRDLEVLEEWHKLPLEVTHIHTSSPRHITIQEEPYDTAPSSPLTEHSMSSIGHPSVQNKRPEMRASTVSYGENLDVWANDVEHVRIQRNETAVQLKGMKKTRHNLKRTLRDTETQLYQMEKQGKPAKRPQNLLRKKSRPVTPHLSTDPSEAPASPSPQTPTRPVTSHGVFSFSSPRSTVASRHSTYISSSSPAPETERPKTSTMPLSKPDRWFTPPRPNTSHSLGNILGGRPTTSAGLREESAGKSKDKRRWSLGLRGLFHRIG
ncbi:hypothetical protein EJ02DRAFT_480429 [Clathrospora elynae]|uniref:Uncharacterized protein n=1 Tax=Clathrospora elynae TaxID=706981 RepID=A0A6A5SYE3_9PLEO|nr:hypothetical protein EJ02DRAFT_480429 [Clathrospora elynae]